MPYPKLIMNQLYYSATFPSQDIAAAIRNMGSSPKIFVPASFLDFNHPSTFPYIILVLNSPISRGDLYEKCASRAMAIMAADGGGNRIFDFVQQTGVPSLMNTLRPETIIGDLDSLRPETEKFFRERGTAIVKDNDLYSTDFTKALRHMASQTNWWLDSFNQRTGRQEHKLKVLIFGGLGGRADQAFSQIHHLFLASRDPALAQLEPYLVSGDSIIFALGQGDNVIETPLGPLGENIGIIPVGRPARLSTKGLEWDVEDWETSFGTQLSTSNYIRAEKVSVRTTEMVLFTVEIPKPSQESELRNRTQDGSAGGGAASVSDSSGSAPTIWSFT